MFLQTIPVENLSIIYADMNDIITYNVQKRDLSEWIKKRIHEIEDSLLDESIPNGEILDFASIADISQDVIMTETD
jgi:hypothetical protein